MTYNVFTRLKERTVEVSNGCWEWTAERDKDGYGRVRLETRKRLRVHRVAWEFFHGPIPPRVCVLHSCDNPPCWNPFHLFLGTQAGNVADMCSKRRQSWGVGRPRHVLTPGAVLYIRASDLPQRQLAAKFGVAQATIWKVQHRIKWNLIEPEEAR